MPTSRTRANRKYNEKTYAQLGITIPKGRKALIAKLAAANGENTNHLVNRLLWEFAGMTETEWRRKDDSADSDNDGADGE